MADPSNKGEKNGKAESDQAGGLAKSFDQYEYVGVITPGAALLLGLLLIYPGILPGKSDTDIGLGALGIFLVAAYVAGHILRAIGDFCEKQFWRRFGGMPSEWILWKEPAARPTPWFWSVGLLGELGTPLDAQQRAQLETRVSTLFKIDFNDYVVAGDNPADREEKYDRWQVVTRRIYATVRAAQRSSRIDAFNRTYGMMVGISVALVIIGLALWLKAFSATHLMFIGLGLLAFLVLYFTVFRAAVFGKLYARELYVTFLDVTKP